MSREDLTDLQNRLYAANLRIKELERPSQNSVNQKGCKVCEKLRDESKQLWTARKWEQGRADQAEEKAKELGSMLHSVSAQTTFELEKYAKLETEIKKVVGKMEEEALLWPSAIVDRLIDAVRYWDTLKLENKCLKGENERMGMELQYLHTNIELKESMFLDERESHLPLKRWQSKPCAECPGARELVSQLKQEMLEGNDKLLEALRGRKEAIRMTEKLTMEIAQLKSEVKSMENRGKIEKLEEEGICKSPGRPKTDRAEEEIKPIPQPPRIPEGLRTIGTQTRAQGLRNAETQTSLAPQTTTTAAPSTRLLCSSSSGQPPDLLSLLRGIGKENNPTTSTTPPRPFAGGHPYHTLKLPKARLRTRQTPAAR
eukprot:NODE_2400_length_1187_cov_30.118868_g2286_i0.p1 GENE.NODE_2400_length_1187_cov_30.118868_g2286_i0~~NODE_2400_length_1187_cov_30.118868_g2286_i0.p1  ORF type:complete len:391 (-),score=104.75 NODE_2400_length_1187_cov_30.118868_g2286_i0:15-1127(-)